MTEQDRLEDFRIPIIKARQAEYVWSEFSRKYVEVWKRINIGAKMQFGAPGDPVKFINPITGEEIKND